jgi:hypothetical protein
MGVQDLWHVNIALLNRRSSRDKAGLGNEGDRKSREGLREHHIIVRGIGSEGRGIWET